MTFWQREDFTRRFIEYQQKRKEEHDQMQRDFQASVPALPSIGRIRK